MHDLKNFLEKVGLFSIWKMTMHGVKTGGGLVERNLLHFTRHWVISYILTKSETIEIK